MFKNTLILFWVIWLLDVLMALFGYREFIGGVFGRYAAPTSKMILLWGILLVAMLAILIGSLYLKNHERSSMALIVAAIPLVLALPYVLFVAAAVLLGGKNTWH